MKPLHTTSRHAQRAFSLTEIMVGMVIGMLGIIIIMQMTSLFESRKRTTTGGDDAQNGGAIALYSLQNQISQAGYGISNSNLIGKPLRTPNLQLDPALIAASSRLYPVIVNPIQLAAVQTANTDSFIVIYGTGNTTAEGALISNSTATLPYVVTGGTGSNGAALGEGGKSFAINEWVIPSQSGVIATHNMYQVIGPTSTNVVAVSSVPPALSYTVNQANPPLLYNLGTTPVILAYAVINGTLSVCDYFAQNCAANAGAWSALADGIVSMRAQCNANSGLRIALVSRSVQIDLNVVTTATPTWNPNGASAVVEANPAANWGANWNRYRYKTFETIVPIRNAIWAGVPGCQP